MRLATQQINSLRRRGMGDDHVLGSQGCEAIAETFGQHLLRRLRRRQDRISAPVDDLPPTPTASQLEQAMVAAKGGRAADCEQLSLLLLANYRRDGAPARVVPTGNTSGK